MLEAGSRPCDLPQPNLSVHFVTSGEVYGSLSSRSPNWEKRQAGYSRTQVPDSVRQRSQEHYHKQS
ncbi:hypothetical protein BDD12DRAFT_855065 [Trichophaea hybrida]|nr:hypothetical protein BDD12DRAFT_855065 [Trichophaea hybrida]